jgi:hypothetical protein
MKHVWHYAKEVMLSPSTFFKSVHNEKGLRKQFIFITVFAFIVFVFLTYQYLQQFNDFVTRFNTMTGLTVLGKIPLTIWTYIGVYASLVVLYILLSFLRYGVTHLFVILFNGKYGYHQTYKAMVYTLTPEYISSPLLAIFTIGMAVLDKNWLTYLTLALIFLMMIILAIYQMYLRTVGLSKLQKISPMRSFLSIYVLGLIAQLVIVGIAEIILLVMGYGIYLVVTQAF